ncbi:MULTISPECIES: carbohydrate ABC transporter permease [Paenibacillus]|jgi:putative aldouronate transport system permease protein|uniref:carbohydrate ABC transporter permease n=1 Tax=Paenibacillus TaxID=44249 RepID=UPI00048B39EE|nr:MULTISPECIES: carbohydrate ABC transporter permease [Paenibacillus]SME90652.1 carbohydrate ABC transporter membrane protein 2, CUT1 family (TC 3.A.1.1.-) [Paenibacillus barengoltzii]
MHTHPTKWSRLFDSFNYVLLGLVGLAMFLPFVYVLITSFSNQNVVWPTQFSLEPYRYIFSTQTFIRSIGVSVYITVLGTFLSLLATALMAYSLSFKFLPGRSGILLMVLFTMVFQGGMIPTYFVVKNLHMLDSTWSLMIPGLISAFYLIVMRDFFSTVPMELIESAKIDGAHELTVLLRIVLPLSLPALAAFGLFYAVGIWNQYFNAILYINEPDLWPVQVILRQIVILASAGLGAGDGGESVAYYGQGVKMAVIVVSTLPIMIVYPFLQKHFAKGALLGSVKG